MRPSQQDNRRSAVWPKSVLSQIEDVDENFNETTLIDDRESPNAKMVTPGKMTPTKEN